LRNIKARSRRNWSRGGAPASWLSHLRRLGHLRRLNHLMPQGVDVAPAELRISRAQRTSALAACVFAIPTLLCLWIYVLLYKRDNLMLLYLPLGMAAVLLGVVSQHLSGRATSGRQPQMLVWSTLLYALLVLGYRAWEPQAFDAGLNLLMALLVVMAAVVACLTLAPALAGIMLGLTLLFHSLPLLLGVFGHGLSGRPLLIEVAICLMLASVLALIYSSSWTQLALWKSVATSQQMEYLSLTDHLTGLGNRRSLYSSIEELMAEMNASANDSSGTNTSEKPPPSPLLTTENSASAFEELELSGLGAAEMAPTFSIALLDIDRFKIVNDSLGHASGDAVLRGVAEVLQASLRQRDVAGRWGGEEFVLILPGLPLKLATGVAERLRGKIAAAQMLPAAKITASFGVTSWQPGDTLEALMARADAAMYQAKRGGRNRVEASGASVDGANLHDANFYDAAPELPGSRQPEINLANANAHHSDTHAADHGVEVSSAETFPA
jgi:diguanylate cyclase (GGDEF)-like protein